MPEFNPANAILIAADSVEKLRKCDVFRVLDCQRPWNRVRLSHYILANRPELTEEVHGVMEELMQADWSKKWPYGTIDG